ncbi:hypothetical protein [Mycobacterium sp. AT1]|uniref:hypothetical protein n=1 Tax=Mycobacterium sp. AT1 TaxID=1961706 RepID=UPI0009AD8E6C|nr:hypothetical protein [Mycobacterium sp. AT1]OPX05982.1 hypothetical protein B1790_29820 [Mycobacterium sp. AT1]
MTGQRDCDSTVTSGRMDKATEFLDLAAFAEDTHPTAAAHLYVDAGIAAADVICCVRLGMHSNTGSHSEARALLKKAESGSERHLATLPSLKNKAAYTHEPISPAECKKMNRAAGHLVEAAKRAMASTR